MLKVQEDIKQHLKERDWLKSKPAHLAKSISIEAAELLEVFQWEDISLSQLRNNPEKFQELKDELADVCIYTIEMSIILGLDIETVIYEKLQKVQKKYPVELVKGNNKNYFKIKKEYRKNA